MATAARTSMAEEFLGEPDPTQERVPLYVVRGAMDELIRTEDHVRHQREMLALSVGFDRRRVTAVRQGDVIRISPDGPWAGVENAWVYGADARVSLALDTGLYWTSATDADLVDVRLPDPEVPR